MHRSMGIESQKNSHAYMVNELTTKETRIYNSERTVFSINDVGTTGQPHAKE